MKTLIGLLALASIGCATSPLQAYLDHEKGKAENMAWFDKESELMAALCRLEPERCGNSKLQVNDCIPIFVGQTMANNSNGPYVDYCLDSPRSRALTSKFQNVQSEREIAELRARHDGIK
jgi:hypothetical protein